MKTNSSAEAALHIVLLLASSTRDTELTVKSLADYYVISRNTLAKVFQQLSAANIVVGSTGRTGGYRLARSPHHISAYDVASAIDGVEPRFHCHEIRQKGPCGANKDEYSARCVIARTMDTASSAWRDALSSITVADLATTAIQEAPKTTMSQTIVWYESHSRTGKNNDRPKK